MVYHIKSKAKRARHAFAALFGITMIFGISMNLKNPTDNVFLRVLTVEGGEAAAVTRTKISAKDKGAEVWIVNTPKCGTGAFETSIITPLGCTMHKNLLATNIHKCKNDISMYRTHFPSSATEIKRNVNEEKKKAAGTTGSNNKCIVLSAIRNPLAALPSRFFESYKDEMCDGKIPRGFVIAMYEKWLRTTSASTLFATAAEVLEMFGIQDFYSAMERLEKDGYQYISSNDDPDSPWYNCELLFTMIDYNKENTNLQKAFAETFDGIDFSTVPSRTDLCPNAADTYQALKDYKITENHIQLLTKKNPELLAGIQFYRKLRDGASTTAKKLL